MRGTFGNPFRPVAADHRWLTTTVVTLADTVDQARAFDRLPILADALEEAGCDSDDILAHCRGGVEHQPACGVADVAPGTANGDRVPDPQRDKHWRRRMGLNYSIDLAVPIGRTGDLLTALARIATASCRDEGQTTVYLPTGQVVTVPFSSDWEHAPIHLDRGDGEVKFETDLLFPLDDALRGTYYADRGEVVGGVEHSAIGCIYLTVRVGCLYAEFSFTAATSEMSGLFVRSAAVRGRFRAVLAAAGGVAGWLDRETFGHYRLDAPSETFEPEWDTPAGGRPARASVDRDTAAVCRGLGHTVPEPAAVARCRTGAVVGLARGIDRGAAYDRLPILADALEEAGCDNPDILAHCRRPGDHPAQPGERRAARGDRVRTGRGVPARRVQERGVARRRVVPPAPVPSAGRHGPASVAGVGSADRRVGGRPGRRAVAPAGVTQYRRPGRGANPPSMHVVGPGCHHPGGGTSIWPLRRSDC